MNELRFDSEVTSTFGLEEVERPGEMGSDEEDSGLTGRLAGSPDASFGKSRDVLFAYPSSTGFTWVRLVSTALKVLKNIQIQRTRRITSSYTRQNDIIIYQLPRQSVSHLQGNEVQDASQ